MVGADTAGEALGYGTQVFTGIRPTGDLTIANYLGAVREIVDLQQTYEPVVFVADVHGMTDQSPDTVAEHREEVVKDFLALGVDPDRAEIFTQSQLLRPLGAATVLLSGEITLNELTNVPTLKDKLGDEQDPLSIRTLMALYPVLMAADILAQRAELVPVGKDQIAHIELTRDLARRFNDRHEPTFPMPSAYMADGGGEPLKILALTGDGKMSKSQPGGALFLADDRSEVTRKVRRAQTGMDGQVTPHIESLVNIAKGLTGDATVHQKVDGIIDEYKAGGQVMGQLKGVVTTVVNDFLGEYRYQRAAQGPDLVHDVLAQGNARANARAEETLDAMMSALKM
jgi:tryptophanyl-tRNA synthetase